MSVCLSILAGCENHSGMSCITLSVNFLLNYLLNFPYNTCDLGNCQSPKKALVRSGNFEGAFLSEEMHCNSMQHKN